MAALTEEQSILRDAAQSWLRDRMPVPAFRQVRDSDVSIGYDPASYAEMAQMGWTGVITPEPYGGSDFGYRSLGLVLEELGRTLAASPLLTSALTAAAALRYGGTEGQKQEWLPKIVAGAAVGTLAVDEGPHHEPEKVGLVAERTSGGFALSGMKTGVPEGMAADLFVVSARTAGRPGDRAGISLFLVSADAAGLTRERFRLIDSRGWARLTFDKVVLNDGALLGGLHQGWGLLERVLDCSRAGLAAEMLGNALAAFEMTLEHLKTRVQFGQLLGTFQALQHRAANMFTELELARSCVEAALAAHDEEAPNTRELASLAKAKVGTTLQLVTNEAVQMHGGMGMTDAHDVGLYLKRARVADAMFGGVAYHRERYALLRGH
jgi:alkylation response protein AidB-like acyl-CoA dehydrogenase